MATHTNQANDWSFVILFQIFSLILVAFTVAVSWYGLAGNSWLEQNPESDEFTQTDEVVISSSLDALWMDYETAIANSNFSSLQLSTAEFCNSNANMSTSLSCIDDRYVVADFQESVDDCESNQTFDEDYCNEVLDLASAGDMAQFFLWFGIGFAVLAIVFIFFTLGGLNTRYNFTAAGWFSLCSGSSLLVGVFLWSIMIPGQSTIEWEFGSNVYMSLIGAFTGIIGGGIPLKMRNKAFAAVENWPAKTQTRSLTRSSRGQNWEKFAAPNPVQPQYQRSGMPVGKRRIEGIYDNPPPQKSYAPQGPTGRPNPMAPAGPAGSPQPTPINMVQNIIGDSFTNRFSVRELLAEGGMAQVFLANETATNQTVIWKQAHGKHNPLKVSNKKLEEEAELMQIIRHQRIPAYIAHGEIEDSKNKKITVLVQEYIEGGDLKNTVEQVKKVGMNMPLGKCREYLIHICEPLEQMASMPSPVYHRDLKPHNIIIHPTRGPVIIDFGLAKMVATGQDLSVTRGGSGTWTPPERDSGVTGPFTDVWSLGKILFFILTNESPPAILDQGEMVATFSKLGHPEWLAGLISWACWPQYQKRIQSVQQFRILLENEGVWPESSGQVSDSSSDDFTTWS